ncbi:MAG: glycosyltransferase family 39 protein [Proteobacteria bacterium]|nr:glycosyltransferase family 39 protein [Pseudomonadota bacterium]MBU1060628.1 glycosyltransferase family 39 protein [Pseudomonadota bacterium]
MTSRTLFSGTGLQSTPFDKKKATLVVLCTLTVLLALYFRLSGVFRGLADQGSIFHPDEPKQIVALFNFLNGEYVRYYGSLFYDGYPYGLNHLDEYLLRPLLFFFGPDIPNHFLLYYYARLLRVVYGLVTMAIAYPLVYRLVKDRSSALLAMFLLAIAPLSITVTHFATGDIGVDLFTALCFLFLLWYRDKIHKKIWLVASGLAVGAAFASKYNGLLVGMVPAMVLCFEFQQHKDYRLFAQRCLLLMTGAMLGTALFTPNLLLDPSTTLTNMFANFEFIKNYNVPEEILVKPWLERALLGFKNNSLYIIASLGYTVCLSSLVGLVFAVKKYFSCLPAPKSSDCSQNILLLAMALFPLFSLCIALSGKYVVQPFHFSYLQLPLIVVTCTLFSILRTSHSRVVRSCSILMVTLLIVEFAQVSWKENFFWRLEDNAFLAQNLPSTIYDREAFYTHRSAPIRSLYLEPFGNSVFRNHNHEAKGPDASFWNTIEVAPLPQVANPLGKNWIFLNGPTFPRNERMLQIQGQGHGQTIKRYLVLPAGQPIPTLGIRSGSYATSVTLDFGGTTAFVKLEAHQQKVLTLKPKKWKVSGGRTTDEEKVSIIPLEISVPHNDIWVTLLISEKEKSLFTLFGGGQDAPPSIPEKIPAELEKEYFSALSRVRYLESSPSWRVATGKRIPMWEVALPAGSYKLISEVEGLVDESTITIELEDAKGELYRQQQQSFQIKKGIQRIEYSFSKPFVPYQGRLVISGLSGTCHIHTFKLFPDYRKLSADFTLWRTNGGQPRWISRFGKELPH